MLTITEQHRIYVACQTYDFRMGIDGFAAICRKHFDQDPFSGCCFIFRNRRQTAIKVLLFDGSGFWLCYKRLSRGRFQQWPKTFNSLVTIDTGQLNRLLQQ